ncbi:hypothetical protein KUTeg_015847 [Tegillarca granosa]|uniref:G-protein coupled receptors family 1 profile domain-containing protein n=1 Tax=Tegillarca granosa TaxID=220873 RepID=A0ABQ9EJ37_TEGGR|nr:hypothetical protein KUTeg_015847 [Tegillarca granosa]
MDMNNSNGYFDYNSHLNGRYYMENLENLRKPWIMEPNFIPTVVVYGAAFLVGVIGNILVIFAVLGDRKSRSVTSNFMLSLAVADILFLVICVPYNTSQYVVDYWTGGTFLCKFAGFIEMLSAVASILNLSSVSVERRPIQYSPTQDVVNIIREECNVSGQFVGYRTMWKRLIRDYGLAVKRNDVMKIMQQIFPNATEKRKAHRLKRRMYTLKGPNYDIEIMTFYNNVSSITKSDCGDVRVDDSGRLAFAIYKQLIMFSIPSLIMLQKNHFDRQN